METQNPNNQPGQTNDLTYQVMPQVPNSSGFSSAPPPPVPTGGNLPSEPEHSWFRSRLMYIVIGVIVLATLGISAYFLLGAEEPAPQPQTRLPKNWINEYFNREICDDQATCGDEADPDNDGLKNYDEFVQGTKPINPDTDEDGLADGDEIYVFKTDPTLKYTDRREVVVQNDWSDGFQIKGEYDPLTPGFKFTDLRRQQIITDTGKYNLHEPSITTLSKDE